MGRTPFRLPNYLEPDSINNWRGPWDYIVFLKDSEYWARNQKTGEIVSKGATADIPINYAITNPINPDNNCTHIHLKTGNFVIANQIDYGLHPTDKVIISGEGKGFDYYWTRIFAKAGFNDEMIAMSGTFSELRNVMIDGNLDNVTKSDGVTAYGYDIIIDNVTFYKCKGNGIMLQSSKHCLIKDTWIEYMNSNGIQIDNDGAHLANDKIINCHITTSGLCGIMATLSGTRGSILVTGTSIEVSGARSARPGIDMYGVTRTQIIGNVITSNDNIGIRLGISTATECANNIIANNIIQDPAATNQDYGIQLLNATAKTKILGNTFLTNVIDDISIAGTCTDTICNDNGVADIPFTGTRTRINGIGYETANAEAPADAAWQIGEIVNFVDSGDATGNGIYIKNTAGLFIKLT